MDGKNARFIFFSPLRCFILFHTSHMTFPAPIQQQPGYGAPPQGHAPPPQGYDAPPPQHYVANTGRFRILMLRRFAKPLEGPAGSGYPPI